MDIPAQVGISPTLHIRGMIATRDIKKGEVIERCPLILFPTSQEPTFDQTILGKYYFEWTNTFSCIVLGYGSLINHSFKPNVEYCCDYKNKVITFKAIVPIKKGEEICSNYNGKPSDLRPVDPDHVDFNKEIVT